MSWEDYYQVPSPSNWQGRRDTPPASCFFQTVSMLDLTQHHSLNTDTTNFAILGFCCDEGIRRNLGRTGAAEGPAIFRSALAKLPLHRNNVTIFDAGNIVCNDHDLEGAQAALGETVCKLLDKNITPILIGGGHEIAWGHFLGLNKKLADAALNIVNFDAHFDMRPLLDGSKGSSGTPFLQIAQLLDKENKPFSYHCIGIQDTGNIKQLFKTAEHHQVNAVNVDDMLSTDTDKHLEIVTTILSQQEKIYLTICLDVFSAAYAPGVSAPQAFGLNPWHVIPMLRKLAQSGLMLSYDIAELSPKYDKDLRTVKLAAKLAYEIIHHHSN